jgi:site-specific DNA recombinase
MVKSILPQNSAVLYLRMSDERQEYSIDAQRAELLRYAEKHSYKILREYLDEAISGDDTGRRAEFLRMREDVQKGEFSVVLCWDQDRFGRFDGIEGGFWIFPFRQAGVRLETIAQGRIDWDDFHGRLVYMIQQESKHSYLRDLSRNVARGQLDAAKNGRGGTGGRAPAGYKQDGDEILVDPEWAAIIRAIFAEYLKPDASLRSVVEMLNTKGILTTRGNKWSVTTVRDTLSNRKYTGAFVRFRYRVGKYHAIKDGEIVTRQKTDSREEPDPMVVEDRFEAIINKRTFERVQRKLAKQQKRTQHRTGHQYTFTGLLRCGDCGGPMGGAPAMDGSKYKKYFVYRCRNYHSQGPSACHCNSIGEDKLLNAVSRKMQAEVFSETAIERLLVAYRKRLAARRKIVPADDGRLRKQIDKLNQQIDQGVERVLSAPEKLVGTIYAKIDRLRAERDRLQAQLDAAGKPETGSVPQDAQKVEEAARVLRDMREAFKDAKPEEIRELISPLVSKIELHFDHVQEGKKRRNPFQYGTVFVRPTDPALSLLFGISEN